jgi:phage gp46-like protein
VRQRSSAIYPAHSRRLAWPRNVGDIRIQFDNANGTGDFVMVGPSLQLGNDLETACLISLFTDAQADPDDNLPEAFLAGDPRGWWADTYLATEDPTLAVIPNDRTGSKLWQVTLRPRNQDTLNWAQNIASLALQWMIIDGVATAVNVTAQFIGQAGIGLIITITEPTGQSSIYRYAWAQEG